MDRYKIINEFSNGEFAQFLEKDNTKQILELLNEEGIKFLKRSKNKEERITYILNFSKYANEIFLNTDFLNMFLDSDISYYYASLRKLEFPTYDLIIKAAIARDESLDLAGNLLIYFNDTYVLKFLDGPYISKDIAVELMKRTSNVKLVNKIIEKYDIDLVDDNINIYRFFELAKSSILNAYNQRNKNHTEIEYIEVPALMINSKLAKKIFEDNDIFKARKIIDMAEHSCDVTPINEYIKNMENTIISGSGEYIHELNELIQMIEKYNKIKEDLKQNYDYDVDIGARKLLVAIDKKLEQYFAKRINVKEFLEGNYLEQIEDLNKKMISNYVIDYHFEENYYNIMLDIKELLHFYYDGNIVLEDQHVDLYNQILNIDFLSVEEKKVLHENLKNYNMKEMFYDDMLIARRVVNETIKESSLSRETLKKYIDKDLSEKYGVDVYVMDGEPFFGIVKTGRSLLDNFPTGHSFSLVGAGGLATYGNVQDSNTFLYDSNDVKIDQIVHVYPFDSFTLFRPFENVDEATMKVNNLSLPDEIVSVSPSYNEILILEKGKIETGIDEKVPMLQQIALYCLDNISENDVLSAKANDVGILLVNASKYKSRENLPLYTYRMGIDFWNYNYFNGIYEKDKFEATR